MINLFLSGADISLRAVNDMEAILLENLTKEAWIDDAVLALAQFSPGGGTHFLDEAAVSAVLKEVKADLQLDRGAPMEHEPGHHRLPGAGAD